jgi:hypothetical protein
MGISKKEVVGVSMGMGVGEDGLAYRYRSAFLHEGIDDSDRDEGREGHESRVD